MNQYFGMTVTQTLKSWTAMKVIESLAGLGIVLAIHALLGCLRAVSTYERAPFLRTVRRQAHINARFPANPISG